MKISRLFLIFGALAGALYLWLVIRDPLTSLPLPEEGLASSRLELPVQNQRHTEHVTLHSKKLGDIGIVISLPDPMPSGKLPLLLVLGGLGTGENNIRYVTGAGQNAIIGYDWPMPVRFYNGLGFVAQMPDLYERLFSIPGQVVSSLKWLSNQPWVDKKHISLLGFSLGALAAPAIQDLAQNNGVSIGWTIIAYGGSPFGELFATNPHIRPFLMRIFLAPLIDLLLRPLEPTEHLPYLKGHFLVLEGQDDSLIPAAARKHLRDAVPEPKTLITFEGNHMGVGQDKMALLEKIIAASKKWLMDNGAVNATP